MTEQQSNDALRRLGARIIANHLDGEQALAAGREHRSRASTWLTESALLLGELIQAGVESRPEITKCLGVEDVSGARISRTGEVHAWAARLVMGPSVDARRAYRVSAAARQLVAMGANDLREALRRAGGVSALATLWGQRGRTHDAAETRVQPPHSNEYGALAANYRAVPLRAPCDIGADLLATRGTVYAIIEVGRGGELTLIAVDTDVGRIARSGC